MYILGDAKIRRESINPSSKIMRFEIKILKLMVNKFENHSD